MTASTVLAEAASKYPRYTLHHANGAEIETSLTSKRSLHRLRSFKRAANKLGVSGTYVARNGTRVWTFIRFAKVPKPALVEDAVN